MSDRANTTSRRHVRRPSPGARRVLCLLLALLTSGSTLSLLGCASGERVDFWPLYYSEKDPRGLERPAEKDTTVREVLYPIFSMESTPDRQYHAVRPLYNYEHARDGSYTQVQALWPLFLYRYKKDQESEVRIIPIFDQHKRRSEVTGKWQTTGVLFPVAFWGTSETQGPHFALFPLGGVIKRLIVEEFKFAMFPIWSQTKDKDYTRNDVLWPIVTWGGTADGNRRVLRVWPFYVHKEKKGESENNWVMWPFGLWGKENAGGQYPRSYGGIFPFYIGNVARDKDTGKTVAYDRRFLYFVFVRRKDERKKFETSAYAVLWPFTNFEWTPNKRDIRIWPLYWQTDRKSPGDPNYLWRRYRVLWPLIWIDRDKRDPDVNIRDIVVAPLYWDYSHRYKDETTSRRITFWPLYTFQRDRDGSLHHWLMSFGWNDTTKGFKRNLRAFFDLFQYHELSDGRRSLRVLWRLFAYDRDKDWYRLDMGPFFGLERDKEYRRWSCVLGIIKREADEDNVRWRILYIPFGDKAERPKH